MSAGGSISFPENTQEILDFMEQEAEEIVYRSMDDDRNPFIDGWGSEMRFQRDMTGYEIRSAGPDKNFNTDDDIYLSGNIDSKYIVDDSERKNFSKTALLNPSMGLPYQEPTRYYQIKLPGKYTVVSNFTGGRSETAFAYAKDNQVTIIAEPIRMNWEPEKEMNNRLSLLRRGEDQNFSEFTVTGYGLTNIGEASGYEISLKNEKILVHEFSFCSNSYLSISISIISSGNDRQANLETLKNAVQQSLELVY